ncbi:MAG: polysaccharide biosynthesis protein, partial [Staphylococcus epidermidis]|nr:polysaccharide biosynthesis protein [Staphylococcus epidermidis]
RLFLEPTRFNYLIIVAIGVIVGAIIYGGITIKTKLADEFLGDIPAKIRRKVKMLR